jgi:hypothetical protein
LFEEIVMDRHNMMLFLQQDTAKEFPIGYEDERTNFFDPQEDEVYLNLQKSNQDLALEAEEDDDDEEVPESPKNDNIDTSMEVDEERDGGGCGDNNNETDESSDESESSSGSEEEEGGGGGNEKVPTVDATIANSSDGVIVVPKDGSAESYGNPKPVGSINNFDDDETAPLPSRGEENKDEDKGAHVLSSGNNDDDEEGSTAAGDPQAEQPNNITTNNKNTKSRRNRTQQTAKGEVSSPPTTMTKKVKVVPLCCARPSCRRKPRHNSIFCSDGCGVAALEIDLLRSLEYSKDMHPVHLRS